MGEAQRRQRLREGLIGAGQSCTYCTDVGTTVEHMPPRMMFTKKHRPRGLEFASCHSCNVGTKDADLLAALISRSMMQGSGEAETEDLPKLFKAVRNNLPDALREMRPSQEQLDAAKRELPPKMDPAKVMSVRGPLVSGLMQLFATKMTFALYREISGQPVPEAGGVLVRWFSNYEDKTGRVPPELFQNLLPRRTLQQGRFEVSDQFQYSFEITPERDFARIVATFRYAFAIAGFIAPEHRWFDDSPGTPVKRGMLLSLDPRRVPNGG